MGDEKKTRQYSFDMVLDLTLPSGQKLIGETARVMAENWQRECEEARLLSQDKDRLGLWRQLVASGAELSQERARRLSLAEKILDKRLREGKDGWVELPEKPESKEEN